LNGPHPALGAATTKIVLASDHAGFDCKEQLTAVLSSRGHDVVDAGTRSADPVDYPEFIGLAAKEDLVPIVDALLKAAFEGGPWAGRQSWNGRGREAGRCSVPLFDFCDLIPFPNRVSWRPGAVGYPAYLFQACPQVEMASSTGVNARPLSVRL
jgi:hypothetical protein